MSHLVCQMPSSDQLQAEIEHLKAENARLVSLLDAHGIPWASDVTPTDKKTAPIFRSTDLSTNAKVALFHSLFRGREDVYPIRWESSTTGKSGYSPACANEWKRGVCLKPRVKCSACDYRELLPLTDQTVYDHLAGKQTIGVYPLLADETCYFLAVDFDDNHWRNDICAFYESCYESSVPVSDLLHFNRSATIPKEPGTKSVLRRSPRIEPL